MAQLTQPPLRWLEQGVVDHPQLRQSLVGRDLAGDAACKGALHADLDALLHEHVGPQGGDGEVGGNGEALQAGDASLASPMPLTSRGQVPSALA